MVVYYLVYYLICVFGQAYIVELGKNWTFVFPTVDFIKKLIQCSFIIVISCITLKRLKKDTSSSLFELVTLISYLIGSWLILSVIFVDIEQRYINNLDYDWIFNAQIIYIKLVNYISRFSVYLTTVTILLEVSLVIMIIVRKFDITKYILPKNKKEFKWSDAVLSACIGTFLGIPGLLFEIIWLLDAKTDNIYRFKKMRFWYIMGCIPGLVLTILILLSKISQTEVNPQSATAALTLSGNSSPVVIIVVAAPIETPCKMIFIFGLTFYFGTNFSNFSDNGASFLFGANFSSFSNNSWCHSQCSGGNFTFTGSF